MGRSGADTPQGQAMHMALSDPTGALTDGIRRGEWPGPTSFVTGKANAARPDSPTMQPPTSPHGHRACWRLSQDRRGAEGQRRGDVSFLDPMHSHTLEVALGLALCARRRWH